MTVIGYVSEVELWTRSANIGIIGSRKDLFMFKVDGSFCRRTYSLVWDILPLLRRITWNYRDVHTPVAISQEQSLVPEEIPHGRRVEQRYTRVSQLPALRWSKWTELELIFEILKHVKGLLRSFTLEENQEAIHFYQDLHSRSCDISIAMQRLAAVSFQEIDWTKLKHLNLTGRLAPDIPAPNQDCSKQKVEYFLRLSQPVLDSGSQLQSLVLEDPLFVCRGHIQEALTTILRRTRLPSLKHAEFRNFRFVATPFLKSFLRNHSAQLETLHFKNCWGAIAAAQRLNEFEFPRLRSLTMTSPLGDRPHKLVLDCTSFTKGETDKIGDENWPLTRDWQQWRCEWFDEGSS